MYSQARRPLLLIILVCGAKVYFLHQEKNNQQFFIANLRLNSCNLLAQENHSGAKG